MVKIKDERANEYRSTFLRLQDMMTQVTLDMDRALMTFSIAALAALAALNDAVFAPYGWLSFFTFVCFIVVVVTVMIGYPVSKSLLVDAQNIITRNFKKSLTTPLGEGLAKVKFAKFSNFLNTLSLGMFVVGMLLFVILMTLYIGGVKI